MVDEIGYLPISRTGAMLFFQLMTRRNEHASTVLTSNNGFEEWGEIFGDEVMGGVLVNSAGARRLQIAVPLPLASQTTSASLQADLNQQLDVAHEA